MSWRQQAACRDTANFFDLGLVEQRNVCLTCPVMKECLYEGLSIDYVDRYETWGGVNFNGKLCKIWRCECAHCGLEFYSKANHGTPITCSDACRVARKRKGNTHTIAPVLVWVDEVPKKECVICGAMFQARSGVAKTCSSVCRKQHYRNLNNEWSRTKRPSRAGIS